MEFYCFVCDKEVGDNQAQYCDWDNIPVAFCPDCNVSLRINIMKVGR